MLLDDLLQWYYHVVLNYATVIKIRFPLVILDQIEVDQLVIDQPRKGT